MHWLFSQIAFFSAAAKNQSRGYNVWHVVPTASPSASGWHPHGEKSAFGAGVGAGVGVGVGAGVGARVGADVGAGVGADVGAGVGARVGADVGAGVGADVGADVGAGVGADVSAGIGADVRLYRSVDNAIGVSVILNTPYSRL